MLQMVCYQLSVNLPIHTSAPNAMRLAHFRFRPCGRSAVRSSEDDSSSLVSDALREATDAEFGSTSSESSFNASLILLRTLWRLFNPFRPLNKYSRLESVGAK
jgi:hypothetical protein